ERPAGGVEPLREDLGGPERIGERRRPDDDEPAGGVHSHPRRAQRHAGKDGDEEVAPLRPAVGGEAPRLDAQLRRRRQGLEPDGDEVPVRGGRDVDRELEAGSALVEAELAAAQGLRPGGPGDDRAHRGEQDEGEGDAGTQDAHACVSDSSWILLANRAPRRSGRDGALISCRPNPREAPLSRIPSGARSRMFAEDPRLALTFDDISIVPGLSSAHPNEVDLRTLVCRGISLNIPILSAAMDTVTESRLAIALAQQGGMGVVHKNLPVEVQAEEVDKVKRSESGMIVDPVTIGPDQSIRDAQGLMARFKISGVPVTDSGGHLVGILTNRDLRFEDDLDRRIGDLMTRENLVTVPEGTTLEQAKALLHRHRIEKLLVVDANGNLKGLITVKDIQKMMQYPTACKDELGRLRVGAAVGSSGDYLER